MKTIKKRITVNLSQEDLRMLSAIQESTGENMNTIFKKALYQYFTQQQKDKK
jgi:hypothetical protein